MANDIYDMIRSIPACGTNFFLNIFSLFLHTLSLYEFRMIMVLVKCIFYSSCSSQKRKWFLFSLITRTRVFNTNLLRGSF